MQTIQLTCKGQLVTFQTPYTNAEALGIVRKLQGPFARSLVEQFDASMLSAKARVLSSNQWNWVHFMAVEAGKAQQTPRPQVEGVKANLSGVIALFDKALSSGLKAPKIHLFMQDGSKVKLAVAGQMSKQPGTVGVTDGRPFGEGKWYGRILRDGTLQAGRDLDDNLRNVLEHLSKDPAAFAAEHGHKSGYCCCCGRRLDDERSTEAGYGPICAEKFGLPWGERPEHSKVGKRTKIAVVEKKEEAAPVQVQTPPQGKGGQYSKPSTAYSAGETAADAGKTSAQLWEEIQGQTYVPTLRKPLYQTYLQGRGEGVPTL